MVAAIIASFWALAFLRNCIGGRAIADCIDLISAVRGVHSAGRIYLPACDAENAFAPAATPVRIAAATWRLCSSCTKSSNVITLSPANWPLMV